MVIYLNLLHVSRSFGVGSLSGGWLNVEVLGVTGLGGTNEGLFGLGFVDFDDVGLLGGATVSATGIVRKHDGDLDTNDTLLELAVADSSVDVTVLGGVTGFDHVTVLELDGLGTRTPQFTGDNDLGTFGTVLEDVAEDTVAGTAGGKTSQQFVANGFGLGNGAQGTVLHTFGVELDVSFREVESFLDLRSQFSDALTLLTQDGLSTSGTDDDFSAHRSHTDFDAGVTILAEFTLEELVEFGIEDTVLYELTLFGDVCGTHFTSIK